VRKARTLGPAKNCRPLIKTLDGNNMEIMIKIFFSIIYIIIGSYFIYGSYNKVPKTLQQCYTLILPGQPKWLVALSAIVLVQGIYGILILFVNAP